MLQFTIKIAYYERKHLLHMRIKFSEKFGLSLKILGLLNGFLRRSSDRDWSV